MSTISYLFLIASLMQLVWCGNAWFYQTTHHNSQPSSQLVKHQFLLPPYPSYQHDLLHQPPSHHVVHENRYYGTPGEFAEPSNYNELSFEGPYEITSPQVPGLYFRLSSGVFVPVKAVYSFPPFLERIIQRIQGYYSVYNPPDALGIETPIPTGGGPIPEVPPQHNLLPVIPPNIPPPGGVPLNPEPLHPIGPLPPSPSPAGPIPSSPESPKPDEAPMTSETPEVQPSTTTESTKEETTPSGESASSSSTESIESSTDSTVEETTTA